MIATEDSSFPIVIEVAGLEAPLVEWAAQNKSELLDVLARRGAVLFRGVSDASAQWLERFAAAIAVDGLLDYVERSSPRSLVSGHVYTSTEYPRDQTIFPHNENSYAATWPRRICFLCTVAARAGGETPLVDVREVLRAIDPSIRARFQEQGILYMRTYGGGLGLDWRTSFQTTDRRYLEELCAQSGYEFRWLTGDRFQTRRRGAATMRHPDTADELWFNHAAFFNVAALEPRLRAALQTIVAADELPNNTFYGNGEPIEDHVIEHLSQAYLSNQRMFSWKAGDLLVVDNLVCAHGRRPFDGPREVLVAMSDSMHAEQST